MTKHKQDILKKEMEKKMDKKTPVEHALVRSTVKLMTGMNAAPPTSTGTGFFYKVTHPASRLAKILIITNKHVVKGADVVHFVLSSAEMVNDLNEQQQPTNRVDHRITLSLNNNLYPHPDPDIDLCGIDITVPTSQILNSGQQLRSMFLDSTWLPSTEDKISFRDVEQVLVIGYPRGLWDEHNNMPIARLGTTATHPMSHYQGKKNFLVDVAAFLGSSGSPVFTYEAPMFRQPNGAYTPGTKVNFIGVVWGVIEATTSGELRIINVPSALKPVLVINTSLHLAAALHADAILEIDNMILPKLVKSA